MSAFKDSTACLAACCCSGSNVVPGVGGSADGNEMMSGAVRASP
jgi:hypothetical protein